MLFKNIFNIPFGESFLDRIAQKLILETKKNPEILANYLLITPNQRVIKNMQEAFLRASNANSLILPRIISINNLEYIISPYQYLSKNVKSSIPTTTVFKPVISPLARSYILAKLVRQKDKHLSLQQATALAESLGELIDEANLYNVDFEKLKDIVDINLSHHWQDILKFIQIATQMWPTFLEANGLIDASFKHKGILETQSKIWQETPYLYPIITLNISSFYPCILNLLNSIALCERNQIFFYGLDYNLENTQWDKLYFKHPQKVLQNTLKYLKVVRNDVINLYEQNFKEKYINNIFDLKLNKTFNISNIQKASASINILEVNSEDEEAKIIALAMREALETKEETVGVISNNPNLIYRVTNELRRWDINVNDYLGEPLKNSSNYKFFILCTHVAISNFNPHLLLALLKHPFSYFGYSKEELTKLTNLLDLKVLRENIIYNSSKNYLEDALKNIHKIRFLSEAEKENIDSFISTILKYYSPLSKSLKSYNHINFQNTLVQNISVAESITYIKHEKDFLDKYMYRKIKDYSLNNELWSNQEGDVLSGALTALINDSTYLDHMNKDDYLEILKNSLSQLSVIHRYNKHPRLYIYGSLQSNLIHHDTIIISSFNENNLPYIKTNNPWGNKYILQNIGFIPKEHMIGLQANTLAQNLNCPNVILTRSSKEGVNLTTPSRWLQKLKTSLEYYNIDYSSKTTHLLYLKEAISNEYNATTIRVSAPNLGIKHTSIQKIPITAFEKLLQNPYIFFVDRILNLKPLNDINPQFNKALYGTYVHEVLEKFISNKAYAKNEEEQINYLNYLIKKTFKPLKDEILFMVFQYPILKKSLISYITNQKDTFKALKNSFSEKKGFLEITLQNNQIITIEGHADRIDIMQDDSINIIDYKTSSKRERKPYMKQGIMLPLIALNGGFKDIVFKNSIDATYIFLPNKVTETILYKPTSQYKELQNKDLVSYISNYKIVLEDTLNDYFCNSKPFVFSSKKDIKMDFVYFSRYSEWNTNIDDEIEENQDES